LFANPADKAFSLDFEGFSSLPVCAIRSSAFSDEKTGNVTDCLRLPMFGATSRAIKLTELPGNLVFADCGTLGVPRGAGSFRAIVIPAQAGIQHARVRCLMEHQGTGFPPARERLGLVTDNAPVRRQEWPYD
jgi:hypothetical protein